MGTRVRASRYGIRSCSGVSLWDSLMFGRVLEYPAAALVVFPSECHMGVWEREGRLEGGIGPFNLGSAALALGDILVRASNS